MIGKDVQSWSADLILSEVESGDERPWSEEIGHLWEVHPQEMVALLHDVRRRGIVYPVQINLEKSGKLRVIDGHHRIAVALALRVRVPVEIVRLDE